MSTLQAALVADCKPNYKNNSIICIDISGSVGYNSFYWLTVKSVVQNWLNKFPEPVWCFWDNNTVVSYTPELYHKYLSEQRGYGGTMSDIIIPVLKKHKIHQNILIITDGAVDTQSIDRCDSAIRQHAVDNVECHIINNWPNLSVTCPFTRRNTCKVYTHRTASESNQLVIQRNSDDYKILDELAEVKYDTFMENYDRIYELLVQVNMGSNGNSVYKDALVLAKNRLLKEHSKRLSTGDNTESLLRVYSDSENWEACVSACTDLTKNFYANSETNSSIVSKLDKLINICNGGVRHVFDPNAVKSQTFNRAGYTEEVQVEPVVQEPVFECPITYDMDSCCLLVRFDKDFWAGLDKSTTDFIRECPLRALGNPSVVDTVKSCLMHSVGLRTVPDLNNVNPFTREPFDAVISLANHHDHIKYNNWVLANMLTRGKTFGNFDCWLYVVYKIVCDVEHLRDVAELFREHLVWRYRQTKSYASLSGLGLLPTTELPFNLCCLYILYSSYYVQEPKFDTIRFHMPNIQQIQDIVTMCFGSESVTEHIEMYILKLKFLNSAMSFCKRSHKHHLFLQNIKHGVYQNTVTNTEHLECALIDGPQENLDTVINTMQELFPGVTIRKLDHVWIYNILSLVNPSKNSSDISVKVSQNMPEPVENWVFSDYQEYLNVLSEHMLEISYMTFRPMTHVKNPANENEMITWRDSMHLMYGTQSGETFSGCRYFLDYFLANSRVPTEEEYIVYCYSRVSGSGKFTQPTVPKSIREVYKSVMREYKPVFMRAKQDGLQASEIKQRVLDSVVLAKREQIEKHSP